MIENPHFSLPVRKLDDGAFDSATPLRGGGNNQNGAGGGHPQNGYNFGNRRPAGVVSRVPAEILAWVDELGSGARKRGWDVLRTKVAATHVTPYIITQLRTVCASFRELGDEGMRVSEAIDPLPALAGQVGFGKIQPGDVRQAICDMLRLQSAFHVSPKAMGGTR